MKKIITTLLIYSISALPGYSELLTFQDVVTQAVKNSHRLKISKINTKISEKEIKEAKSEYYPVITAYANAEYSDDLTDGTSTVNYIGNEVLLNDDRYQNAVSLGATYNVFDFGTRKRKLDIAKTNKYQKEEIETQDLRDLKLTIVELYTQALTLQKELKSKQEILSIQGDLYKINERLNAAGQKDKTQVVSEAIKIAELTSTINQVRTDFTKTMQEITHYTNQKYNIKTIELENVQQNHIVPVANVIEEFLEIEIEKNEIALDNTPEAKIYDLEIQKKQKELELIKRQNLPKFQFDTRYYLYGTDSNDLFQSFGDTTDRSLTFRLSTSMDLFDGFKNKAKKEKAKLEIEKIKADKEQTLSELNKKFEQIQQDMLSANEQLKLNYEALNLVNDNISMIERLNKSGVIDKTAYLNQKAKLLNKKFEIEQSQINNFTAQYKLDLLKAK